MSVLNDFQVNGLFPSVINSNTSSAQYFPRLLGTSIGVQSVAPSSTSAAGQLVVPGFNELQGEWFDVIVGASALDGSGDPSATFQLELVANTGTVTNPSYTSIATITTAAPATNVAQAVGLRVSLFGDSASGVVAGYYTGVAAGTLKSTSLTTITANLSGVNMGAAVPFGLVVRGTFSTANASNKASLYNFQIVGA